MSAAPPGPPVPPIPMVRYGNERLFPGAEWGAKDTRNLFPVAKVDVNVT